MAIASIVSIINQFSGDLDFAAQYDANNAASPGDIDLLDLSSGNNTITPPSGAIGVTIIPPEDNAILIKLKGVTVDTGVPLHLTNASYIAVDSTLVTFVLNAASAITGVRLIWS